MSAAGLCRSGCAGLLLHGALAFGPVQGIGHSGCGMHATTTAAWAVCTASTSSSLRMALTSQSNSGLKSRAIPWLDQPEALDGSMIGDQGFDPLGLATSGNLERYREAELKHGRLAMVALAGWPVAELVLGVLTKVIPPAAVCTGNGCAIDGQLSSTALPLAEIGKFSLVYWGSALVIAAVAEVSLLSRRRQLGAEYIPGDLSLDPFRLSSDEMRLKELKHGRLAMFAFLAHYLQVLWEKKGVVVGHQLWGQVCVYNLRADLGFPAPICYPRPEAALDTTLSWEIMWRVLTGYFKEPYF